MNPLERLALAALVFFGLHAFVSGTALREALVRRLGVKLYRALFSLASFVALSWLWLAFRGSPCAPLWVLPRAFGWLPICVMPFAFFLMAGAFCVRNPTAVGGEGALLRDEPARGVLRITRHPFLWGVALWASVHLLVIGGTAALWFFGSLLATALLGTRSIDRKRRNSSGEGWSRFAKVTSNLPFVVLAQRRNRLVWRELALPALFSVLLTVTLLFTHRSLFDVSPLPG